MEFYQLVLIVILYSSIQSIIGIGLLLFGTPTLLLAGYSYPETLWILLPASCSLSLMQIFEGRALIESKRDVFIFTLPALFFSLILVIQLDYIFDIKKTICVFKYRVFFKKNCWNFSFSNCFNKIFKIFN